MPLNTLLLSGRLAAGSPPRCVAPFLQALRTRHPAATPRQWICRDSHSSVAHGTRRSVTITSPVRHLHERYHPPGAPFRNSRTQATHFTANPYSGLAGQRRIPDTALAAPLRRACKRTVPSKRKTKTRHRSPSDFLVHALRSTSQLHALPATFPGKVDLSYVSVGTWYNPKHPGHYHPRLRFKPSLQYYLALYIEKAYAESPPNWHVSIPPQADAWLRGKGYASEDLRLWATILLEEDSYKAARLLLAEMIDTHPMSKPIPIFVLLFLLRREEISARALRILIRYANRRLEVGQESAKDNGFTVTDEKSVFLVFLRLLRKARVVCPGALPHITKLVTTHINPLHAGTVRRKVERDVGRRLTSLTFMYNRALSLLSHPASIRPFLSAASHEQAQFDVLRRMSEYEPPIAITQEGYRAVARVQLAHRKTAPERVWAELKSKSWPPWKEDRTAMDQEIRPEHGISRAVESIRQMQEAGYPVFGWERTVNLLAGWDDDGSPVIQNRALLARIPNALVDARAEERGGEGAKKEGRVPRSVLDVEHGIWAARVRATRTLEEAWSCFLAYDALAKPQDQSVYLAMFERIVLQRRRESRERNKPDGLMPDSAMTTALPGDGKEVWPTSESPHERLDPRLIPPDVHTLLDRMLAKGLHPRGHCLAYLVRTASSIGAAHRFLKASRDPAVAPILKNEATAEELKSMPESVFNAYIETLCRYWTAKDGNQHSSSLGQEASTRPILHRAVELMDRRGCVYRPGWSRILSALAKYDAFRIGNTSTKLIRQTLKVMEGVGVELDEVGFQGVCRDFGACAATRAQKLRQERRLGGDEEQERAWGEHMAASDADSKYLRLLFNRLVGADDSLLLSLDKHGGGGAEAKEGTDVPRLLATPTPSVLHDYTRALGAMHDYEGLLSVATFMAEHASELDRHTDGAINGRRRLRVAVVALRVFLERSWEADASMLAPAPKELVVLARAKVESRGELGGWATAEEVEVYVQRGRASGVL